MIISSREVSILLIGGKGGGVSEGLFKCLNMAGYSNITLLEYNTNNPLYHRINKKVIINTNPDDGLNYINELLEICYNSDIKVVVPGTTWESKIISKYRFEFESNNIIPLVNNFETIELCADKRNLTKYLKSENISVPSTFDSVSEASNFMEDYNSSMIIKPVWGHGSQNIFLANNLNELQSITEYFTVKNIDYIIQQNMSDNEHEYTVGIISTKAGRYVQSVVMNRKLMGGATGYAKVVNNSVIESLSEKVSLLVGSAGPLNIQLRTDFDQTPYIFEINPRFSGSAPMRALAGFNELDLILNNFVFEEDIHPVSIYHNLDFYRVFQEIIVDKGNPNMHGIIRQYI